MRKTAFIGFGEVNTPVDIIVNKCKAAQAALQAEGVELVSVYPVTDDYEEKDIKKALDALRGQEFDALVLCIAGWIPTHAVVKITEQYRHLPMVLWGLCGWREGDRIVTTADQAGTSALRKTFADLGYRFRYVYDIIGKKKGLPVYKVLGGTDPVVHNDITIGINAPEKMEADAKEYVFEKGFRILKVKVGNDASLDALRLTSIKKATPAGTVIRASASTPIRDTAWRPRSRRCPNSRSWALTRRSSSCPGGILKARRNSRERTPLPSSSCSTNPSTTFTTRTEPPSSTARTSTTSS